MTKRVTFEATKAKIKDSDGKYVDIGQTGEFEEDLAGHYADMDMIRMPMPKVSELFGDDDDEPTEIDDELLDKLISTSETPIQDAMFREAERPTTSEGSKQDEAQPKVKPGPPAAKPKAADGAAKPRRNRRPPTQAKE